MNIIKTTVILYFTVLIPVASTVIPLDQLPQYTVGAGFGLFKPSPGKEKPDFPTKLITGKIKESFW